MSAKLYIFDLGSRDAIKDKEEIVWFWEQKAKRYQSQAGKTKYWITLREAFETRLLNLQAYGLLDVLKTKATDEHMKNRANGRLMMQANNQLEISKWEDWQKNYQLKKLLTTINCLN